MKYLKFDKEGRTTLELNKTVAEGFSFRKVHYTHEDKIKSSFFTSTGAVFEDPEFDISAEDFSELIPGRKIVIKRLYELYRRYPSANRPIFFPVKGYRFDRLDNSMLPSFAIEIGLFPIQHYRSLFITQEFQQNGLYEVVVNMNGRWETDVVDDRIPVFEETNEPIWGMDVEHSWQIILLKFWAKKKGSYGAVKEGGPFEFIEGFSNCNWKYFNISREKQRFLDLYTDGFHLGKFVLKTKDSENVHKSGLVPNSAGYEIIHLKEHTGKEKLADRVWTIAIRSTLNNRWTGDKSILDSKVNELYNSEIRKIHAFALERDFVINDKDFFNLFSACWVASVRERDDSFSNYHLLKFEKGFKRAAFFEFEVKAAGWLDFCIKQHDDIAIEPTKKSSLRAKEEQEAQGRGRTTRFLKCKFLLARLLNERERNESSDYDALKYELYEIEYSHGYNRGDALFVDLLPGQYLLKIKPEQQRAQPVSTFVVHYASNLDIELKEIPNLPKRQSSLMLRHCLVTLVDEMKSYPLDPNHRHEKICYANLFNEIGYSFVGVRSKKSCPYNILIEVDPRYLLPDVVNWRKTD